MLYRGKLGARTHANKADELDPAVVCSDSLVKIDDDRLQALLDEIQTMRKFQS